MAQAPSRISGSRLVIALGTILFIVAGLLALGVVHAGGDNLVEALALFGFACWLGSSLVA